MCGVCGCGASESIQLEQLKNFTLAPHTKKIFSPLVQGLHQHASEEGSDSQVLGQTRLIQIEKSIQSKNNTFAERNRKRFERDGVLAINMLSSPGSGKTSLLVRTLEETRSNCPVAVIEGDQQSDLDAERIRKTGVPAWQINTGKGCHLEAQQVGAAYEELSPLLNGILFVENVGNLVCPAAFDLGEGLRVVVLSVTEGEDKPLKYPDMFVGADIIVINKIDLLPYVDFNLALCEQFINRINANARVLKLSVKSGEGLLQWCELVEAEKQKIHAASKV